MPAEDAHGTVQVIPFSAGAHAGMPGSFIVLSFPNLADPEVIYVDSMAGDLFLDAEADIRRHSLVFDNLRASTMRGLHVGRRPRVDDRLDQRAGRTV